MTADRRRPRRSRWRYGVPVAERGPGESFRPEDLAPSVFAFHQPGIATPVLDHLAFGALDVSCGSRQDLGELLGVLTAETERLMRAEHRTPAPGRPAGALTITVGFGPTLFDGRFGLAAQRPVALAALPRQDPLSAGTELAGRELDGASCEGGPGDRTPA